MITDITEIVAEAGVKAGAFWVTADNRVGFTRSIPAAIHQRLRNVLLNA
jgi:hypothetical protein